jgi:hypothetical protein
MVRLAVSLKNRLAPPEVVVERLASAAPADRLAKALTAYGRIVKTIYILRYIQDENSAEPFSCSSTAARRGIPWPGGCSSPIEANSGTAT